MIKLLLMDADGVLSDGRLYHFVDTHNRLVELKALDSQDGIALIWLAQSGIKTGIISGRSSKGLEARARLLKMSFVVQDTVDKLPAFERILSETGLSPEQSAFIGDDLTDIPVLRRAGLAVAVANARPEVKRVAHQTTQRPGGRGAVREVAEFILKTQGHWHPIAKRYQAAAA